MVLTVSVLLACVAVGLVVGTYRTSNICSEALGYSDQIQQLSAEAFSWSAEGTDAIVNNDLDKLTHSNVELQRVLDKLKVARVKYEAAANRCT